MSVDEESRPARAKRLPREVRERQILDAAVTVFSQHGYHNASMDEISDVAGVSKPMIYAYLGHKEDLFAACIRREASQLMAAIADGVHAEAPPDMQLWHGLRAFFRFVGDQRESWRVLHRQATSQGGPFSEELLAMRTRAITLVDALLVRSATSRGHTATQSTEALAAALVGAGESLADWWLDHPDVPEKVVASWLMNLVWMGLGNLVDGAVWTPTGE
ncbi:TetR/AcrR family transcriptional regulator [Actinokineospora globicatena]|uniref:TetR family transcriptional regulator n=1 Tax=Actinokineospora globicatena TaxID=103729 RepID=A0A9W6QM53_9PSEU|nr:TetR/AcrR family transcriptional regulator [Actinokineospora globicatena]MCP2301341.1 transcriptional regulator, TetR family [Actinokineospora globicatena]GLW77020.1 TetR family transcriptional regulator [Actinokineospora globicatena]GLW83854.1 TetR family transcriptional regulator [Actinokineospora globicatena]GLW92205.1 TetR family transcriptional regulator [Actinokineospora globicatena]